MRAMVAHGTGTGLRVGWYLNNCICSIYDYGPELEERIYRGSVAAITKYNFSGVKLDSCGGLHNTTKWAELLAATGREVLVENCNNDCIPGGVDPDWPKGHCSGPCKAAVDDPVGGICPYDFFRISNDIFPFWDSVMNNLLRLVRPKPIGMTAPAASGGWLTEISRPGRWAYPDMLQVGNLASFAEDRSHFGAWCIVSSPLILGYDLTNETTARRVWPIISNVEAISINQQWAGHPGALVHNWSCPAAPQVSPLGAGCLQLWAKPLPGGKTAVLLLNTKSSPDNATVELAWLGLKRTAGAVTVRDVWQRRDLAPTRSDTGVLHVTGLASHDSRLWVLGAAPATSRNPEEVVRASLKADDDDDVHTSSPSTTGRPKRSIRCEKTVSHLRSENAAIPTQNPGSDLNVRLCAVFSSM
jgi:alpha-galactosidase